MSERWKSYAKWQRLQPRLCGMGEEVVVPARDIVPGDVILLRSGDKVSADARLFEAVNLQIEEAVLTGESLADARLSSTQRPGDGQEPDE